MDSYRPQMTQAGRSPVYRATVVNHLGEPREIWVPGETPLTIKIDGQEIVTLMTLGTHPEELALGYLRNQRLVERIEEIASVAVDWEKETALPSDHPRSGDLRTEGKNLEDDGDHRLRSGNDFQLHPGQNTGTAAPALNRAPIPSLWFDEGGFSK